MIRTIIFASAFLLATTSLAPAEDRGPAHLDLGFQQQHLLRADMNLSPREYEAIYSHNRRLVLNNLRSYSQNALESIGMPEHGINLMGAALGLAVNGPRLNLNNSKTLALEVKDASTSERALYIGVELKW